MAKVLFVQKLWYESLGVMQISAAAKMKGHQTHLWMDNGNYRSLFKLVKKYRPDVIGFALMTGQHVWALEVSKRLKEGLNNIKPLILYGGPHPTFFPGIVGEKSVDIICRGEGERAFVELLDCIDNNKDYSGVSNLWVKNGQEIIKNDMRPLINDMDSLPFMDRELFYRYSYFRDNPNKMFIASRGCPFKCAFCFNEKYSQLYNVNQKNVRRRSPENMVEEIKLVKGEYKATKVIRFHDDIFTLDRDWLFRFLEIYKKEVNMPFMCYIRAGIDKEEVIKALAEARCVRVTFGLETGNEKIRSELLGKTTPDKTIRKTCALLKKYKIKFYTNNIFFIPQTNIGNVWETIEFNQELRPDYVMNHVFQPYPGTALNEYFLKNGYMKDNYLDNMRTIYSLSVFSKPDTDEELNIYYFATLLIKFPWLTPFIKPLTKCMPNILFLIIYKVVAGLDYMLRCNLGFFRFMREAYHSYSFR